MIRNMARVMWPGYETPKNERIKPYTMRTTTILDSFRNLGEDIRVG
jgi:hypothetical protein